MERALQLIELAFSQGSFRFAQAHAKLSPISTATLTNHLKELVTTSMLTKQADGSYRIGPRYAAWFASPSMSADHPLQAALKQLAETVQMTVALWTVHAPLIRCQARIQDEHSPSLSRPGDCRPISMPTLGAGLLMNADTLRSITALRRDTRWATLTPDDHTLKQIATDCLKNRIYDDRAAFWNGSRRLAIQVSLPNHQQALLGLGMNASRLRYLKDRDPYVQALHQTAQGLQQLPSSAFDF